MKKSSFIWSSVIVLTVMAIGMSPSPATGGNPDYKAKIISAPTNGTRGQPINVTLCTTNAANLDKAITSSSTRFYINTTSNFAGATELTNHTVLALLAKKWTNWTANVTIPAGQALGTNYLIGVCDKLNTVTESNENNNTNSVPITIN